MHPNKISEHDTTTFHVFLCFDMQKIIVPYYLTFESNIRKFSQKLLHNFMFDKYETKRDGLEANTQICK